MRTPNGQANAERNQANGHGFVGPPNYFGSNRTRRNSSCSRRLVTTPSAAPATSRTYPSSSSIASSTTRQPLPLQILLQWGGSCTRQLRGAAQLTGGAGLPLHPNSRSVGKGGQRRSSPMWQRPKTPELEERRIFPYNSGGKQRRATAIRRRQTAADLRQQTAAGWWPRRRRWPPGGFGGCGTAAGGGGAEAAAGGGDPAAVGGVESAAEGEGGLAAAGSNGGIRPRAHWAAARGAAAPGQIGWGPFAPVSLYPCALGTCPQGPPPPLTPPCWRRHRCRQVARPGRSTTQSTPWPFRLTGSCRLSTGTEPVIFGFFCAPAGPRRAALMLDSCRYRRHALLRLCAAGPELAHVPSISRPDRPLAPRCLAWPRPIPLAVDSGPPSPWGSGDPTEAIAMTPLDMGTELDIILG